ncbi:MAG: DUF2997 domain-containing protein [Acidobacteria bacterium]|nr:DUF2997 domain-containing protein [Acidobacteriota bacterium]
MSEIQELDVYINPDGTVRIEVRGAKGQGCLGITAPLEEALGGEVVHRELTAEYDEAPEYDGLSDPLTQKA